MCYVLLELAADVKRHASQSNVQCTVIAEVTNASCETEARRDSGISVASSLITSCISELPVVPQQAAIVEEPARCDASSAPDAAPQPATDVAYSTVPAVLPWISLPTEQGYL